MIQVDELSIAYHGNHLFKGASFSIQPGEKCGFVGRNGSGKSTFFRLVAGTEIADGGIITTPKNYRIGILDQHIHFTKPTILEEACLGLRQGQEDQIYKAETILFGLGFKKEDMDRRIDDFSGGYQLRLHLAKVLISEPDCLLLDEPTNYLDIVSIRWFERFLKQWKGEFILITHDREFMDSVTTHTMGIHRQKIRKIRGSTIDFYEQIMLEEEIHEKTRLNIDKKRAQAQDFIDRFGAKASKAAQAQSRQKQLNRIPILEKLKSLDELDFQFKESYFAGKNMLEAKEISFSYDDSELIDQLNLVVEKGDRIAIIGKNGRGKSTILKLLSKVIEPKSGHLKHSDNLAIGYFGQTNIDRLHPQHTIEEEISGANPKLNRTEIKGICGLMMFSGDQANKKTSVLSGGEKSRVLLGKIIGTPCNLLLLDEPTHHLDMQSIEALIDALEDFGGAVILVTHSELMLKRLNLHKILVCHEGKQELFLGNYEEFLDKVGWPDETQVTEKPKKADSRITSESLEKAEEAKKAKALEKEIAQKQERLGHLEKEIEKLNAALLIAIEDKVANKIQELSTKISEQQKKVDLVYTDLEKLYAKL